MNARRFIYIVEMILISLRPSDRAKDSAASTKWVPIRRKLAMAIRQTGAGFGYHDFRIIWFYDGKGSSQSYFKFQNLKFQRKKTTRWPPALQPISNRSAGKMLRIARLQFGRGRTLTQREHRAARQFRPDGATPV